MSSIDYLDGLNREIRRLQKIRLDYKKKVQDNCPHYNVTQTYMTSKMSFRDALASAATDSYTSPKVKVKVVCTSCGKVLNGRRR